MELYVGTSGYSYKEWKGSFYPQSLQAKHMLHFYGEHFRTVEINNTFYRMPNIATLEAWADAVPADFKFALKAVRQITHIQRLGNVEKPLSYLLEVTETLKDRLGPLLFQLPPTFKKDADRLRSCIDQLPEGRSFAFEFRNISWFDDEIMTLLHDHGYALCISDSGEDFEVPFVSTGDWGYLRLRQSGYSEADLKKWIERIRLQNWRKAYVFFKHETDGPLLAAGFHQLAKTN
jgi:uncharacterized protein YecE (DUF72 family)